jgi:hypothetical protein
VQARIRKVSTFSKFARLVCSAIFSFSLVGSVGMFLIGVLGALGVIKPVTFGDQSFSMNEKLWGLPAGALVVGVWLALVYQLYRLFGNLAKGDIYTAENVRRVRHVGLLWILSAVLSVVIPYAWASLVSVGVIEPSDPPKLEVWLSWSESLNSLVSGGLIVLISWVMDVGLYEKDHAAALQRDADLVI